MPPRRRAQSQVPKRVRRQREESPPPPPLPFELATPEQQQRYRVLVKRPLIPSKFFDTFTIHALGLRGDINTFMSNIGWVDFANLQAPTYLEVTYEILSTLESDFHPTHPTNLPSISFRCLGEQRHISMDEFNAIFGFPSEGLTWIRSDFQTNEAWYQLTGQHVYASSRSKASFLHSPALKYIHRVMAMSLFGRGESTGAVTKVDLFFLWAMYNNIKINTGVWLLKQLLHVAKTSVGKICCGGLLTLIAMAYGFLPMNDFFHAIEGSNLVDVDTLVHMKMCRHMGGGRFALLTEEGHAVQQEDEEPPEDDFWNELFEEGQQPQQQSAGRHDNEAGPSSSTTDFSMYQVMQRLDQMEMRFGERMDRLESRLSQSQEMQTQMLNLLQHHRGPAHQDK